MLIRKKIPRLGDKRPQTVPVNGKKGALADVAEGGTLVRRLSALRSMT